MKFVILLIPMFVLSACSSTSTVKRVVLDESEQKPSWVSQNKLVWDEGNKTYFKASQQVRGTERLSGCHDLAKLNGKSALISEIQDSIKGVLDSHEATLNENAEILLSKSRSSEFCGKIQGLRFTEEYFVRYAIGGEERIDCYDLAELSKDDYNKIKRSILYNIEEADPRIKEAIAQKHLDFFEAGKKGSELKE